MTAVKRALLLPDDMVCSNDPPRDLNPFLLYTWHAYNRFAPHVRKRIRGGGAGSQLVADAFREYDRPMSRRDRLRAFDELLRVHDLRGGGVL